MGWRYVWFTLGGLVFVMSILRVTVIRLKETPKYLLGRGKDEEVVAVLEWLATKYNRPCSLTVERLAACGTIRTSRSKNGKWGTPELMVHLRGLFLTRKMGLNTSLIWFSWLLIGLAYPLYNAFLPEYLKSRGAQTGDSSAYVTWRNYAIVNMCGIWGPVLAGFMCEVKFLGRRGTMVVGALVTSTFRPTRFQHDPRGYLLTTFLVAFFFAYTQVRTGAENLGFNCAIAFCLNVYYGTLYAYTPEVMPSAHRATGNGISVAFNRLMGITSAIIATVSNTSTPVPIFICAA